MKRIVAFAIFISIAAYKPPEAVVGPEARYPSRWGEEALEMGASPAFWAISGAVLVGSQVLRGYTGINRAWRPRVNRESWELAVNAGDIGQYQGLFAAAAGFARHDANTYRGMAYLDALGWTVILNSSLKMLVDERRPSGGGWGWPSGHSAAAAAAAGVAWAVRDYPTASLLTIGALLTGYSRTLYQSGGRAAYHSLSQVIAGLGLGAVIGYFTGRAFNARGVLEGGKISVDWNSATQRMPKNAVFAGKPTHTKASAIVSIGFQL